jgi:hypothetical protein
MLEHKTNFLQCTIERHVFFDVEKKCMPNLLISFEHDILSIVSLYHLNEYKHVLRALNILIARSLFVLLYYLSLYMILLFVVNNSTYALIITGKLIQFTTLILFKLGFVNSSST